MLARFGRKQMEQAAAMATSAMGFGGAAFLTMLYFTDWRVIATKIPYYNGKFQGEQQEGQE